MPEYSLTAASVIPPNRKLVLNRDKIEPNTIKILKKGIWLYFWLLIIEGALRKWFLPSLATPLLVVRDPIALWLLVVGIKNRVFKINIYIAVIGFLGMISFFTTIFVGHGNLAVALYGARILIIEFPLIFLIGAVFDRSDVIKIGRALLVISIPMAVLIAIQFYSPQSALINRGIGGDIKGGGFSGALGFYRPPGTFSFTNGTALFFGLTSAYIIYFWTNPKFLTYFILIPATLALLIAIPFSISRSLFFSVALSVLFATIGSFNRPKFWFAFLLVGGSLLLVFAFLANLNWFQTATNAFSSRFTNANESEGGLVKGVLADRYLGGLVAALSENSMKLPFFGYGLGMGTNVGSMLLAGKRTFLISEGEWGRLIGEMGILFGFTIIFTRLSLCLNLVIASAKLAFYKKDLLPWLLLSFGLTTIPQGQWAQPTNLGFGILVGGLIISSFKKETTII